MSAIVVDPVSTDGLEPVGLQELVTTADLQTRRDRKYVVACGLLDDLVGQIPDARVLTIDGARSFAYESVYFDTESRTSYRDAARRRPRRFKARTRSYVDSELCVLEVKTRDAHQRNVKHRHPYGFADRYRLTAAGRRFVAGVEPSASVVDELEPALITAYRRTTLVLPGGGARVTIDVDVTWTSVDGRRLELPGRAIVETKTPGPPCPMDRALWRRHQRPTVISKYGTGLAAIDPTLPANKWNRVLRRHFAPSRDHSATWTVAERSR